LPIIGTRRGGIEELCSDDPSARLFEPENAEQLSSIIAELDDNRSLLERMKSAVPAPRTMEHVCDEVEALYGRLLSN
jgi:hypothetical protein